MNRLSRAFSHVWRGLREMFQPARLLIAVKTAAAVVIAWFVAALLPGALEEFKFYAPLGAIISMSPTILSSLRAGAQTLSGIAMGIALAWIAIISPLPGLPAVFLVVGVGVILAGMQWLGAGRDYVPIAGLFVIIIGGYDAEDYSMGFLIQMGVGAAVGLLVNVAIAPPVYLRSSSNRLSALRDEVADHLDEVAEWLSDPDTSSWHRRSLDLREKVNSAELSLDAAAEGRHLNPRPSLRHYNIHEDYDELGTLQLLTEHLVRLSEALDTVTEESEDGEHLRVFGPTLSSAVQEVATAVRSLSNESHDDAVQQMEVSAETVRTLSTEYTQARNELPSLDAELGAIVYEVNRLLSIARAAAAAGT